MSEIEEIRDASDTVADGVTALVNVTDEGLRGLSGGLERVADGVDALRGVVPTDIGSLIGAAFRESLAPVQGAPGRDGVDGGIGPAGPAGKDGRPGRDGRDGADGVGPPGPAGRAGASGKAGRDGRDGADAPTPVRIVGERDFQQRLETALVYLDDGTVRKMAARRDSNGRISEFVRVSA